MMMCVESGFDEGRAVSGFDGNEMNLRVFSEENNMWYSSTAEFIQLVSVSNKGLRME